MAYSFCINSQSYKAHITINRIYVTDKFSNLDDVPLLISITFLFSISALAQYLFTDSFKMSNHNLLIYGYIVN